MGGDSIRSRPQSSRRRSVSLIVHSLQARGFETPSLSSPDPNPGVSANSTTPAHDIFCVLEVPVVPFMVNFNLKGHDKREMSAYCSKNGGKVFTFGWRIRP